MKSGIIHFYSNTVGTPAAGSSVYLFPSGNNGSNCPLQFNFPIRLFNLFVSTPEAPGINQSYKYEVMSNGNPVGVSVFQDNQNTIGVNRVDSVVLPAGNWPLIRLTLSAGALPTFYTGSIEWEEVAGASYRPVVFDGDSIMASWAYPGSLRAINRGVHGRITPEMQAAFASEVLSLNPIKVIMLGGSNDLRILTGPTVGPLEVMGIAAQNIGASVIVCTIPPIGPLSPFQPIYLPVADWNTAIWTIATNNNFAVADFYSAMMPFNPDHFVADQLHPSPTGYAVMQSVLAPLL